MASHSSRKFYLSLIALLAVLFGFAFPAPAGAVIPVTGMDLTDNGFNKSSKIMMNFGFGFIGLGLVLQGFGKKEKRD